MRARACTHTHIHTHTHTQCNGTRMDCLHRNKTVYTVMKHENNELLKEETLKEHTLSF